jgi:molybdate transport system substrate-binding protein
VLPRQLIVASASDMVRALPELANDFQGRSGVKVIPSFGPSGALAQQIANGAPFDVFLSADRRFVGQLVESKFIDPSARVVYAIGHLVLYSPKLHLAELGDLRKPEVQRFSIANPELAPYGRAAKQALERSGLWNDVQGKIVIAENIRQSLEMVESGNVDASLTSLSLLAGPAASGHPETLLNVPSNLFDQIQQEAGILSRASGNPDARAFLDYLASTNGRTILQRYGFGIPK